MEKELYWIYAFNIVVNSLLSFFTTIFLIELFILLFRIKHPRIKAICRVVPFFKICFDLSLYHFANWALLNGINPILAETGTRQLSVMLINPFTGIGFSMQDGKTFSIADAIALCLDPFWIKMIVLAAITGSIMSIALRLIRILEEKHYISSILQNSRALSFPNLKHSLALWMEKKEVTLALSNKLASPCIVKRTILFPESLLAHLSQEEIEAVIAHEIAHCYWKDCSLRLIVSFIGSLFWWIPSRWWQKRMEEVQEQAADTMIHQFKIPRLALAEAVLKTIQKGQKGPSLLVVPFVGKRAGIEKRIKNILFEPAKSAMKWKTVQYSFLICGLLSILFGRLWIF